MEARFIGDPKLAGDGPATITLYGFTFEKGGAFVDVGGDGRFARNNHFDTREGPDATVLVAGQKGGSVPSADPEPTEKERRAALFAELKELGLTFAKNAKTDVLEVALAQAKAPKEDEEDPRRAELIAQLEGLGVEFDLTADTDALEAALDAATAP